MTKFKYDVTIGNIKVNVPFYGRLYPFLTDWRISTPNTYKQKNKPGIGKHSIPRLTLKTSDLMGLSLHGGSLITPEHRLIIILSFFSLKWLDKVAFTSNFRLRIDFRYYEHII